MSNAALAVLFVLVSAPSVMAQGGVLPKTGGTPAISAKTLQASIARSGHSSSTASGQRLFMVNASTTPVLVPFDSRNDPQAVQSAAQQAVELLRPTLGISSTISIEPTATHRAANVWRTSFAAYIHEVRLRDCSLRTTLGAISGKLVTLTTTIPQTEPNATAPAITAATISGHIAAYLGEDSSSTSIAFHPELIYVVQPGNMVRLAYEVSVRQTLPPHSWRLTVDAVTGQLLEKKDMLEYLGGADSTLVHASAKVWCSIHQHSPFDTLVTVGMPNTTLIIDGKTVVTDSQGIWHADLPDSNIFVITGFSGPSYHVIRHDWRTDTARLFLYPPYFLLWNDFTSNAAERDAFYHVNLARSYLLHLDTSLVQLDQPLTINVNINAYCNAFYDADSNALNFYRSGNECNNSGEIADIIYHEFGHRVAAIRYGPSINGGQINITLAEGFADLVSAFMRDDPRIGIGLFQSDRSKTLRTCDNSKTFPSDIDGDPHVSGEIISGAFWDLRKTLGHDTTERLFHNMEWLAPDGPDQTTPDVLGPLFTNILLDVLTVDDDDNNLSNGTPHSAQILDAFGKHGIGLGALIHITPEKIIDQDSLADTYPITVDASYQGQLGQIDPSQFLVHYTTDNWNTYSTVTFAPLNDTQYQALIPHQSPGTIVSYYITAALNIPNSGEQQTGSPLAPYSFMVGFHRAYYDDCENDRGWQLYDPTDDAIRGRWTRGVPFGTYNIPDHYVQQDTDHTPNGAMCYITGNLYSREIWTDCVDSGTTTLLTNYIDLTNSNTPVLRYWYFYSNDQGPSPGAPLWVTQISGDSGATWVTLQNTHVSTSGWTSYWFRVSDYLANPKAVLLRFIASNHDQAVVEAGIDDVELLESETTPPVASAPSPHGSAFGITSIFPNPLVAAKSSNIQFYLPQRERAAIVMKDVFGTIVARLSDETLPAGSYTLPLPTVSLNSGVYWVVLTSGDGQSIRKLVIE